jgi:hypothetical protein
MSATSNFLKKGSGAKYIINRPYTANCAKRVGDFNLWAKAIDFTLKLLAKAIHEISFILDRPAVLDSITPEEHGSVGAELSEEM